MQTVGEVRAFNRFYTREIRLLDAHLPATDLPLPDARVVYELAHGTQGRSEQTAAELGRRLDIDKAHLSRILARLRSRGIVQSRTSPDHARHRLLSLTRAGRDAFAEMDQGTRLHLEALLAPLGSEARDRLVTAMQEIKAILGCGRAAEDATRLRGLAPGDLGWVTHRHAVLYHGEYGWDWTFEGFVSDIAGTFVRNHDAAREDAWIAEQDGVIVGSVFLVKTDDPAVAQLRLLYVERTARGSGIGRRLVATCIDRARGLGYRRITLWTYDVLVSARRIYEAAGFQLASEERECSFGHDLVGQNWTLEL